MRRGSTCERRGHGVHALALPKDDRALENHRGSPGAEDEEEMSTLKTVKEERKKLNAEVAAYLFNHPTEPQKSVAQRFDMGETTVSRIARKAGLAPRKPGRKPKVQVQQ